MKLSINNTTYISITVSEEEAVCGSNLTCYFSYGGENGIKGPQIQNDQRKNMTWSEENSLQFCEQLKERISSELLAS